MPAPEDPSQAGHGKTPAAGVPRMAAVAFTLWMAFWVPVVLWAYGPANFIWLCNLAQFLLLYAVWRPNALIVSSQAGTICLVGLAWTLDFLVGLATGGRVTVFATYMFDPELPLLARATSIYHIWLPFFVFWLIHRLGYDRRGPWLQTAIGAVLVVAAWLLTAPERNINWVWTPFGIEQVWLPHGLYVAILVVAYPLLLYWPGHFLVLAVQRLLRRRGER